MRPWRPGGAIGSSLGCPGNRRASRVPWLRMCEWAAVAGFDEASNMALDQIAGSHSLAAAANRHTRFTDDNIVLFIHGATAPSTCDFDLGFKDFSWADWMVDKGYGVSMFDKRN